MRVLLINSNRFKQPWPVMPFGLCCVAASLEKSGYEIHFLDLCFSGNCGRDIRNALRDFKPDLIGVGIRNIDNGTGYNTLFLLDKIKEDVIAPLKEAFKGPIIIGGPAVGINGKEMLEFFGLEYAARGDGEICMAEFVRRYEKKLAVEGIDGLIIRKDEKIIQDPPPLIAEDLNSLPIPKVYRYLDIKQYRKFDSPLQIQTKRGCALKCAYCTYNRIEGHNYRFREPLLIAREIEILVKETGIDHIEFTDSVFNIPLDHAKAVLRALIQKNIKTLRLRTLGLNPGAVDEELIDLMKKAGFQDVDLGAESGCDITLKSLGKNYTTQDVLAAGRLLQERKIPAHWYLLVGASAETEETLKETLNTAVNAASKWDLINVGIGIRVYKGSPIAEAMGSTNDNFLRPVSLQPEKIDLDTIKTLVKRASFKYPNIFMYDEDQTTPPAMLMLGSFLLRLFCPNQPIWRIFIAIRKLETLTGVRRIREWLWERQNERVK